MQAKHSDDDDDDGEDGDDQVENILFFEKIRPGSRDHSIFVEIRLLSLSNLTFH